MARQIALIVAVEQYQESRINRVKYAGADARGFSEVLQKLGFDLDNQVILINSDATKTTIESKLRRLVGSLCEDDTFVFFYAGHGFSGNDQNYLTAFDAQLGDLVRTSISLQCIFDMLRDSLCKHSVMFLDSCESGLPADDRVRYIYTALSDTELEEFFRNSEYCICFASCKTGEKSYATDQLRHGIWTYHLIETLSGNAPVTVIRGRFITADSLQNYLSEAVPRTVRESFENFHAQTPWVYGAKSREFVIADIGELLREKAVTEKPVERILGSIAFYGESPRYINRLSGFRSSHFVPKDASPAASRFAISAAKEDIQDEIDQVFRGLREHFHYKARNVRATVGDGDGKIICPAFDYSVIVDLDPQEPSQVLWQRTVNNIRDPEAVLAEAFDRVFSGFFDSIMFSTPKRVDLGELVDRLEDSGIEGLSVDCPYDCAYCDISLREHSWSIRFTDFDVTIRNPRHTTPSKLIAMFQEVQQALLPHSIVPILLADVAHIGF